MTGSERGPEFARSLIDAARSPNALRAAFHTATFYCECGERPGFRALGEPGRGVIPVFTSPRELALARGTASWFAQPGADLLAHLPVGYGLLLDVGGPAPLRLAGAGHGPAGVLRVAPVREVVTDVRYGELHDVPLGGGAPTWRSWRAAARGRDTGEAGPELLCAVDGRTGTRETALGAIGVRPEQLVTTRPVDEPGVAVPAKEGVDGWRTNLRRPPRPDSALRVWSGPLCDELSRATVAPSVSLGGPEQEVRGVVLHSGPPPPEAHSLGRRPRP